MPTFGTMVAARVWPLLRARGVLTEVILTNVAPTVDPVTGVITEVLTSTTVDAKVSPFRPDEVDEIRITALDRKVLVQRADVTTVPTLATRVTLAGVVWSLQAPPELVSNDGLWQLHVRRVGDI